MTALTTESAKKENVYANQNSEDSSAATNLAQMTAAVKEDASADHASARKATEETTAQNVT